MLSNNQDVKGRGQFNKALLKKILELEKAIGSLGGGGGGTELLDEGNGEGLVIAGRTAANFGPVGLEAIDLSYSSFAGTTGGATGANSFVSGKDNIGSGIGATVQGLSNAGYGLNATIAGGKFNRIDAAANKSVVAGGYNNHLHGSYCFMGGGYYNRINPGNTHSAILGGQYNTIDHSNTFVLGSSLATNRANTTFVQQLSIMSIPTSASGLPAGAVWSNGGILTIV